MACVADTSTLHLAVAAGTLTGSVLVPNAPTRASITDLNTFYGGTPSIPAGARGNLRFPGAGGTDSVALIWDAVFGQWISDAFLVCNSPPIYSHVFGAPGNDSSNAQGTILAAKGFTDAGLRLQLRVVSADIQGTASLGSNTQSLLIVVERTGTTFNVVSSGVIGFNIGGTANSTSTDADSTWSGALPAATKNNWVVYEYFSSGGVQTMTGSVSVHGRWVG